MSMDNLLKKFSGVNNLKAVFGGRFFIGIAFIVYGILILNFISIEDIWTKLSIALAFFGLGLMFILDGQSVLREYFSNHPKTYLKTEESQYFLIIFAKLFFIIGSILFFVKFYTLEKPSLYPIVIFILALFAIIIFREKISHFEISRDGILFKMKEGQERNYENLKSMGKNWNFEIREVNKNV